nr:MAG TPA: Baseplate J like protein [Caudoviricetes sp.]
MGFKINDTEWLPQTTQEHATAWMEEINALLEANNVTDENGDIVKLSQNFASALYLQVLAGASRLEKNDEKLNAGINSLNVEACDDQQIENLLPIAAITRNTGSYSTLTLTVTADTENVCVIPAGTKAPFKNVNFIVQTEIILQPGTTQNIATVCDTIGAIVVLKGEITAFETQIPNLAGVVNNVSSVPGNNAETTASLRQRIIKGNTIPYSLDGVKIALENITGVNHARVFFNYNTSGILTLAGGIELQPRTAYVVINGESDSIAETYAKYMNAPTQNAPGASDTGSYTTVEILVTAGSGNATVPKGTSFLYDGMTFKSDSEKIVSAGSTASVSFTAVDVGPVTIPAGAVTAFDTNIENAVNITNKASVPGIAKTAYSQNYISGSGQTIPIKYDKAENEIVFVKVFIAKTGESGSQIENQIKRDLIAASASWIIGQNITSLLTSAPFADCTYTEVAYTQVSKDGETWVNLIETSVNAIPRVSDDTITVEILT